MPGKPTRGSVTITNNSGAPYIVEELGGLALEDSESIDLLAEENEPYYSTFADAKRLVTECTTAQLYQDIQAGKISVTIT